MAGKKEILKNEGLKLKNAFTKIMEIPPDLAFNLPRITMLGNLHLQIENHKGILEYQPHRIMILVTQGNLNIYGSNLVLKNIKIDEMEISGKIKQIEFMIND